MKTKTLKLMLLTVIPAIVLTLASCAKEHKKNQAVEIGRMEVAAVTMTVTVAAIDRANRTVTLQGPDGTTGTYRLGKEVRNFDQIKVGDQVKTTLLESMAVFVGPSDVKPSVGDVQTVALAPKGAKPGILMTNTAQVVAKVTAVDPANRTVTLVGIAEVPRTLTVGPDVNLAKVSVGDKVMVRYTEATAIVVEKP